jgi:copper chaperone
MTTATTFTVPDISCAHCKHSIEDAVGAVPGVEAVDVNIEERTVDVRYDPVSVEEGVIVGAIEGQGYEVA